MRKIKKSFSIFIAFIFCFSTILFVMPNKVKAATIYRTYYVYNALTGNQLTSRTYSIEQNAAPNGNGNEIDSVIGTDGRVVDFSKSSVVKIMDSYNYLGSGFVVDDHTIATAAHCVLDEQLSEILLFNSNGTIALHATPVEYHIPKIYVDNGTTSYDYALISTEEDLSDFLMLNLSDVLSSFPSSGASVSVTGFPQYVNNNTVNTHTTHYMYTGTGNVINYSNPAPGKLYYDADTSSGNSGGPVYTTTTFLGNVYYNVVAIHTNGGTYNSGTKMTFDLIKFYLNNSQIQY